MIEITNPTELRKNMKEKLDLISKEKQHIIVHRTGKEDVVMLPISEYKSWQETNYLLSSQNNRNHLIESINQAKEGKTLKLDVDSLWK